MTRRVQARLGLQAQGPARLLFQLAVSGFAAEQVEESFSVVGQAGPLPYREIVESPYSRIHVVDVPRAGALTVSYRASVEGQAEPPAVLASDELVYLRPSRYTSSDRLVRFAHHEFGNLTTPAEQVEAALCWIRQSVSYMPGSSRPTDGAVDTLLSREGVCRDSSHLLIGFLRAMDIPARFASVYAPGLTPMDFHAVTEVLLDGRWVLFDATGMAPREHLLRISCGRDSADAAFASVYGDQVDFGEQYVDATADGALQWDQPGRSYQLI